MISRIPLCVVFSTLVVLSMSSLLSAERAYDARHGRFIQRDPIGTRHSPVPIEQD